jgi:hypothetical protein
MEQKEAGQKITAYKGFDKNFQCRGFQYEVGKEYKSGKPVKVCRSGFHACTNPLEVWDYYPVYNSRFAEVELGGVIDKEGGDSKICSSEIKIKKELTLSDYIGLCVAWMNNLTKVGDNSAQIGSSGDSAKIGSSGDYAQIGSSGDYAQIGSSGDSAKIGSSGNSAKIGSSGDSAKIGSSGDYAKICSSGYYAQIGSSGDSAKIGSSGDSAKIGSSGNSAQIGSSGNSAQIGSSGDSAQIGSSGNYAQIGSSGNYAQIGSSGDYAKICSSGYYAVIMCTGVKSKAKAKKGSWITLSEWGIDGERYVPVCVKTEQVDGVEIKEDTWYELKGGVFVETTTD